MEKKASRESLVILVLPWINGINLSLDQGMLSELYHDALKQYRYLSKS